MSEILCRPFFTDDADHGLLQGILSSFFLTDDDSKLKTQCFFHEHANSFI